MTPRNPWDLVPAVLWALLGLVVLLAGNARAAAHTYIVEHTILGPTIYNQWTEPVEGWVVFAGPGDTVETRRLAAMRCYGNAKGWREDPDTNAIVSECLELDVLPTGPGWVSIVSSYIRQEVAGPTDFYKPVHTPHLVQ